MSTPFLLVMAAAADVPKSCFKSAENRAASSLEVAANYLYELVQRVKTLMGLEPFEVRFFVGEKFTEIGLAFQ